MRFKDRPPEAPRQVQIIICTKCLWAGGTLVKDKDGFWEHPNCNRHKNLKQLEIFDVRDRKEREADENQADG
jgi:hypothetical protein